MNTEENIQMVQEGYALFSKGDIPALMNLYTDDIEFMFPGPADNPLSGTYRGKEQVINFLGLVNENLQYEQFGPREYIAQGNKVVAIGYERGSARATGQTYEMDWVHVLTIRDGLVSRLHAFVDTAQMTALLNQSTRPEAAPMANI